MSSVSDFDPLAPETVECPYPFYAAMLDRLMEYKIHRAAGLHSRVIVPPGEFYDPLVLHPRDGAVWTKHPGGEWRESGTGRLTRLTRIEALSRCFVESDKGTQRGRYFA